MKNVSIRVADQVAEKESQRMQSMINKEEEKNESLADFNFLRTNFEYSCGVKTWVRLKAR